MSFAAEGDHVILRRVGGGPRLGTDLEGFRAFSAKHKQAVLHEILATLDCYRDHSRLYHHVWISRINGTLGREEALHRIMEIIGKRDILEDDGLPISTDRSLTSTPYTT